MFTKCQTSKDQGKSQGLKQVPGTYVRITDCLYFKCNEYGHIAWYFPYVSDTRNANNKI